MTAWALLVEYDGGPFIGWQRQDRGQSVQSVIEAAVAQLASAPVTISAAGRTDAGVHAAGQVAMAELPGRYTAAQVRDALNFHLKPYPVVILRAAAAVPGWHPRFSATGRSYRYTILNRRSRPALQAGRVWHRPYELDAAAMAEGARHLLGQHDFTSFRAAACQANSPVRTLDRLEIIAAGDEIAIVAEARSFLHHQVRNMAGTLALVGSGRWQPGDVAAALAARDRAASGPTAPAEGLCFMAAHYADNPFATDRTALQTG
jgi:tRNA pseudouridine38-40 synthase